MKTWMTLLDWHLISYYYQKCTNFIFHLSWHIGGEVTDPGPSNIFFSWDLCGLLSERKGRSFCLWRFWLEKDAAVLWSFTPKSVLFALYVAMASVFSSPKWKSCIYRIVYMTMWMHTSMSWNMQQGPTKVSALKDQMAWVYADLHLMEIILVRSTQLLILWLCWTRKRLTVSQRTQLLCWLLLSEQPNKLSSKPSHRHIAVLRVSTLHHPSYQAKRLSLGLPEWHWHVSQLPLCLWMRELILPYYQQSRWSSALASIRLYLSGRQHSEVIKCLKLLGLKDLLLFLAKNFFLYCIASVCPFPFLSL